MLFASSKNKMRMGQASKICETALNQRLKIYNNETHILFIFLFLFEAYDCTAVFKL